MLEWCQCRPDTPAHRVSALKQVDAGLLNVGYVDEGPSDGPPVILLHGWPYDIHSYLDVVPLLTTKGFRVLVPYLRGYGSTRFRAGDTFHNGQQAALATDVIDFMDALKIPSAILGDSTGVPATPISSQPYGPIE